MTHGDCALSNICLVVLNYCPVSFGVLNLSTPVTLLKHGNFFFLFVPNNNFCKETNK